MLVIASLATSAQDVFTVTSYTYNGKKFAILAKPRHYILNQVSYDRTEFKVIQDNKIIVDAYLKECTVVSETRSKISSIQSRRILAVSKVDGITNYEIILTVIRNLITGKIEGFTVTTINKNIAEITYLGKPI